MKILAAVMFLAVVFSQPAYARAETTKQAPAAAREIVAELAANKRRYLPLEPIMLTLRVKNVSGHPVRATHPADSLVTIWRAGNAEASWRCAGPVKDSIASLTLDPGQVMVWKKIVCPEGTNLAPVPHLIAEEPGVYVLDLEGWAQTTVEIIAPEGKEADAYRYLLNNSLAAYLSSPLAGASIAPHAKLQAIRFFGYYSASTYAKYLQYGLGTWVLRGVDPRYRVGENVEELKTWPVKKRRAWDEATRLLLEVGDHRDFIFAPDALFALGQVWISFPLQDVKQAENIVIRMMKNFPQADATRQLNLLMSWEYLHFRKDPVAAARYLERIHFPEGLLDESYVYQQVFLNILKGDRQAACRLVGEYARQYPHSRVISSFKEHSGLTLAIENGRMVKCE